MKSAFKGNIFDRKLGVDAHLNCERHAKIRYIFCCTIPTVIDRIIQQAIAQVLIPIHEPKFSDGSYGYRPNRSAKDAICKVKAYANEGYKWAVSLDLSKYFDTLNHELLMNMLREDIKDKVLIDLIKKYLKSGVMENGLLVRTEEGSPQGGNLSPLLANIYLTKFDKEFEG